MALRAATLERLFSALPGPPQPTGLVPRLLLWLLVAYHAITTGILNGLHAVAQHTGLPIVVIAAAALVLSFNFARRGARLAFEMMIALALVVLATKLGWIHW